MMKRWLRAASLSAGILAVGVMARPVAVQAQAKSSFAVDEAQAKVGKGLFIQTGCMGCHSIGKGRLSGPDLINVTDRRDTDWLKRWMKDPTAMMETDETAKELLKEAKGVKMPNMKLNDAQIDALLHYIASESQKRSK